LLLLIRPLLAAELAIGIWFGKLGEKILKSTNYTSGPLGAYHFKFQAAADLKR